MTSSPVTPPLGSRYELIRELGRGGMGRVLLVRDTYLERKVALKLLQEIPQDRRDVEAFQREFALLTRLRHPAIASAYDFGYIEDLPYFTYEFVSGTALDALEADKRAALLLPGGLEVADALAFLHRGGIHHLDVKPGNLIARFPLKDDRVTLIDFGLFRRGVSLNAGNWICGSLPFMAPEYFQQLPLGPWTDIYAFGVTWYQLATGRFPRVVDKGREHLLCDMRQWLPLPEPPSRLGSSVAPDFDSIILKCLALDPRARFSSGDELLEAFGRLCSRRAVRASTTPALLQTVGRETELEAIDRFLGSFPPQLGPPGPQSAGSPLALVFTGPPGAGLTHLFRELKVRAQTRGIRLFLETGFAGRSAPPGSLLRGLGTYASPQARAAWQRFLLRLRRPRATSRCETTESEMRMRWAAELARVVKEIQEPLVIAVDDLHFFDEVSVALFTDLVRILTAGKSADPPPLGIVAGYREEGPCDRLLHDLSETLLSSDRGAIICPRQLGPRETLRLYRLAGGEMTEETGGFSVFQKTHGNPSSIVRMAAPRLRPSDRSREARSNGPSTFSVLDRRKRHILVVLILLRRPASAPEVARFSGLPRAQVSRRLRKLHSSGLVQKAPDDHGRPRWVPASCIRDIEQGATPAGLSPVRDSERKRIHTRIARTLAAEASGPDDPRMREALHHFLQAGSRKAIVKYGRPLASYLKSTFQHQAALEVLQRVLDAVSPGHGKTRLQVALEIADLRRRVGSHDEGIRLLRGLLPNARRLSRTWEARVQLHLATLHSARGDFQRADSLFREGFSGSGAEEVDLPREELLSFLVEYADAKAFLGAYEDALDLCARGLALAGKGRRHRLRELLLNIHATRANIALRRFDFEAATSDFQQALEIAEAIGSVANQATILNNLGIVYAHEDRYPEAIRTFHDAEKTCLQLDEGPSLSFILGNLAVLHAKTGHASASRRALRSAEAFGAQRLDSALGAVAANEPSRRQLLFFEHHTGLACLFLGRYAEARPHFDSAIHIGKEIQDPLVASFDAVYRCECLIFEACYGPASAELERLTRDDANPQLRRMALSRQALLQATLGRVAEAEASLRKFEGCASGPRVAFLEKRDELFAGWALSLAGRGSEARERLQESATYFRAIGHTPGVASASWIVAESLFLEGDAEGASRALSGIRGSESDLMSALLPLLRARLRLEGTRGESEFGACADLLAEAGAALVENPLPEFQLRIEALRTHLQSPTGGKRRESRLELRRRRRECVSGLPRSVQSGYLDCGPWEVWTQPPELPPRSSGAGGHPLPREKASEPVTTAQTNLLRSSSAGLRSTLVARSPAMRRLCEDLDRLLKLDLPVVIQGETGTGKELVARIIHAESRRYAAPFLVVDCTTVPLPLLETELFGAVAGAFTDLDTDRSGLLMNAEGGTILIDGVVGLSEDVQARLLRVMSEKTFRPVGAEATRTLDARFLFSATRDLETEVREGRLRRDFCERIQVLKVEVPPLRERPEDLQELSSVILRETGDPAPTVEPAVYEWLRRQRFPGNVRELRNLLYRLRMENADRITLAAVRALSSHVQQPSLLPRHYLSTEALPALKNRLERDYILYHLEESGGDTRAVSDLLGVSRKHFCRRCRQLGIPLSSRRGTRR